MANDQMRADFEQWADSHPLLGWMPVIRWDSGDYPDQEMQAAWEAYQAGRADRKRRDKDLPNIQRYSVVGDIAYPVHEDPEGEFVMYEDHVATIEADRKCSGEPVADENTTLRIAGCISRHLNTALDQSSVIAAANEIAGFTAPQPAEPAKDVGGTPQSLLEKYVRQTQG